MKRIGYPLLYIFLPLVIFTSEAKGQRGMWKVWAKGLQKGGFPRIAIAYNHDIFYGLLATGGIKGKVYKGNTLDDSRTIVELPIIEFPSSHLNNIQTIVTNMQSEPIVGILRNKTDEPLLYRFDNESKRWVICAVDFPPNLGAFCSTLAPNGIVWVGAKWSYVYRSTDNGRSFNKIDESASIKESYPCYYPAHNGNTSNGAIYSVAADSKSRVYAGTEGAGVVFSDDNGLTWHPADKFICSDNTKVKDTSSSMYALTRTGNLGAIGITGDDNLVFNGTDFWHFNWKTSLAYADMQNNKTESVSGIPDYLITTGLQVIKIVTTQNGMIFLHSGGTADRKNEIGIYVSRNGRDWTMFNNGLDGADNTQAQGSLAVDGNTVFMATPDGIIWYYNADTTSTTNYVYEGGAPQSGFKKIGNRIVFSNYTHDEAFAIYNLLGQVWQYDVQHSNGNAEIEISALPIGCYMLIGNKRGTYFSFIKVEL